MHKVVVVETAVMTWVLGILLDISNSIAQCWGTGHTSDNITLPVTYESDNTFFGFLNRTKSVSGQNEIVLIFRHGTGSTFFVQGAKTSNGGYNFSDIYFNYLTLGY